MSQASYIDINSIYSVESNFLDNIKNQPKIDKNQVTNLQNKIQTTYNDLNNSKKTADNVYTEQQKMTDIVNTEKDRLDKKKETINNALDGQKRLITMNESYRLRNNDYTIILVTIVISFTTLLALTMISKNFPIIPSFIFDILFVIIISYTLFKIYNKYLDILTHDRINYNELNLDSPTILTPEQIAKKTSDAQQTASNSPTANLLSTINIGGCVGPLCCSGDSYWDSERSICMTGNTKTGFTTLNLAYGNGEFLLKPKITDTVLANNPNEFNRYAKI